MESDGSTEGATIAGFLLLQKIHLSLKNITNFFTHFKISILQSNMSAGVVTSRARAVNFLVTLLDPRPKQPSLD
jgi:hypothetical protein